MKKFFSWVKSIGGKFIISAIKNNTDWLAKKMADSGDIPWVSEKNEQKEWLN